MTRSTGETSGQEIAQALIEQEQDIAVAIARLKTMRRIIDDAEKYLEDN
ncbi:MAG: hypothetical protein AAFR67_15145 [Chloroflexota bacterium]